MTENQAVLPLESLKEGQLAAVRRLKELAGVTGILIGAVRGEDRGLGEDLRPLIQAPNGTVIVRGIKIAASTESGAGLSPDTAATLRENLSAWQSSALRPDAAKWGEEISNDGTGSLIWTARTWYPSRAESGADSGIEPTLSEAEFSSLVVELIALHDAGIGHGHLVRGNIAREGGSVRVLDPGIYALTHRAASKLGDPRGADLRSLVEIAPPALQARVQSAITTGRLAALTGGLKSAGKRAPEKSSFKSPREALSATKLFGTPLKPIIWKAGAGAVLVAAVTYFGSDLVTGSSFFGSREIIPIADAVQLLGSGQPSLMAQVAEAAVLGQRSAQALIVKAASEGKISEPLVNRKLLALSFDPRWEVELSEHDRQIALRLALAKLYPEGLKDPPEFSSLHPGVLLAVVAGVDEQKPVPFAEAVGIDVMSTLPNGVGQGFKELGSAGVKFLSDPSARALCRIIGGSDAERDIQLVLTGRGAGARLRALIPSFQSQPKLSRATLSFIAGSSGVLTELLRWLGSDFAVGWSKSPPEKILSILAGNPPDSLNVEQWADLLSFPENGIRRAAAVALSERFLKAEAQIVTLVASTDLGLTRSQVSILISALSLPPAERDTLLSRWFELKPSPAAIKAILLVRGNAPANDSLNLEAARALNSANVPFSDAELRRLTQYAEPLARALAYSRLAVDNAEQRKILEECAQQERDQKLRNGLLERLSEFARTNAALDS